MSLAYKNIIDRKKSIKYEKLGFFTEWRLKCRGKRDLKNTVVRKDNNNNYYSPFFNQEVYLCLMAIKREKERLSEILFAIKTDTAAEGLRIERNNKKIDIIKTTMKADPSDFAEENDINENSYFTKDVVKAFRNNEIRARISAKYKQIDDLSRSNEKSDIKKHQNAAQKISEKEITLIRCQQFHELAKARISAYWAGVLKSKSAKKTDDLPANISFENITEEIQAELNSMQKSMEEDVIAYA
ncbi:MAG: hypothetical protein LBM65_02070 [Oscillospiraceae bacterium]|nr:hypothetical protein [Oscillospiraceae bacterium]